MIAAKNADKPQDDRLKELAQKINKSHKQCLESHGASLEHARATGTALLEVKEGLGQSGEKQFLKWVQEHCRFSVAMAQRYKRIANSWNALVAKTTPEKL